MKIVYFSTGRGVLLSRVLATNALKIGTVKSQSCSHDTLSRQEMIFSRQYVSRH